MSAATRSTTSSWLPCGCTAPQTKEEVKTLEGLAGVKLRVGGVAMSRALGAVPIAMSATKAHESLQRGTTDGALFPWEAIFGFLIMNQAKFGSRSAAHQAVLDKVGGLAGAKFIGKRWDEADDKGREIARADGNTIQIIAADELERWRAKIAFMDAEWIAKVGAQGHDGAALPDDLRATMKTYSGM